MRTFSSYFGLIVMRTPLQGFAEKMAWLLSNTERPIPIINAGSGKDQHPTQALLDVYTLQRSFEKTGGIEGKTVLFVGDLARGRTVRSLSYLLTKYPNVTQYFVAPEKLQIHQDVLDQLDARRTTSETTSRVSAKADAIYMTGSRTSGTRTAKQTRHISKYYFKAGHDADQVQHHHHAPLPAARGSMWRGSIHVPFGGSAHGGFAPRCRQHLRSR